MKHLTARGCAAALCIVHVLLAANAEASRTACATREEQIGLNMQAMQSELMVAALTCNKKADYNRFVNINRNSISGAGTSMRQYFRRVYSEQANGRINAFVTSLANRTSEVSLNIELSEYCQKASQVFAMLNRSRRDPIELSRYFGHLHAIRSCEEGEYADYSMDQYRY